MAMTPDSAFQEPYEIFENHDPSRIGSPSSTTPLVRRDQSASARRSILTSSIRRLSRSMSQLLEAPPPGSPPHVSPPPSSPAGNESPHSPHSPTDVDAPIQCRRTSVHFEQAGPSQTSTYLQTVTSTPDSADEVDADQCKPQPRHPDQPLPTDSKIRRRKRAVAPLLHRLKPVLVLENSGSVARDHLASERTFLAYVRTSLAIASTGVALVQLFTIAANTDNRNVTTFMPASRQMQAFARPLGATTVILGIVVLGVGVTRYFTVQRALIKGMFPVARVIITGIAIMLGVIVCVVFGILVAERNPSGGDS